MFNLLRNLFMPRRQSPLARVFGRRQSAYAPAAKRGGIAFGTLASIAAPFVIRKLMARRQANAATGTAY